VRSHAAGVAGIIKLLGYLCRVGEAAQQAEAIGETQRQRLYPALIARAWALVGAHLAEQRQLHLIAGRADAPPASVSQQDGGAK
jgi:hypothetical protein